MRKFRTFNQRLKNDLKNPEFKKEFKETDVPARIALQIAKLREQNHLTQKQLSRLLRTSQQNISRLEQPNNGSLTIRTLQRLAQIFHKELTIQFK